MEKQHLGLIWFPHGLGDCVQLTSVLRHLHRQWPAWEWDVETSGCKSSIFAGLARQARERADPSIKYERVYELDWPEPRTCYADSPSTKAERCLREVFEIAPRPDLWGYQVPIADRHREAARRYADALPQPMALLHYQGNTAPDRKNLTHREAGEICRGLLRRDLTPVILDWDQRTPLADGRRIFCPWPNQDLWGDLGSGNAPQIAALIEAAKLVVAVDSGPLHVAAATETETIAIWTGHHPVHYLPPKANIDHFTPHGCEDLLRGDREAGQRFFDAHYAYEKYHRADLPEQLSADWNQGWTRIRGWWCHQNCASQDMLIVDDVYDRDCYQCRHLPGIFYAAKRIVDVGAHIGAFAKLAGELAPHAEIVAIEAEESNALLATHNLRTPAIHAAVVGRRRPVVLANAVFAGTASTGGSIVCDPDVPAREGYRYDGRTLAVRTLDEFLPIDILKLDCEGSEYELLESLDVSQVGFILGEFHDSRRRWDDLIARRFGGWATCVFGPQECPAMFHLRNPVWPPR